MMIASKFDGDDHDDLNLIVSHVGRISCVDFDCFAQVEDRIASHVQRDLMMIAMMLLISESCDFLNNALLKLLNPR